MDSIAVNRRSCRRYKRCNVPGEVIEDMKRWEKAVRPDMFFCGAPHILIPHALSVLELMPQIRVMLEIPEDHYVGMIIGFGYPQIPYVRGTQRTVERKSVHRLFFAGEKCHSL